MILRLDVVLWAMAALLILAAGLWQLRDARRLPPVKVRQWPQALLIALALLALAVGILWHPWRGATGEDGLALLAAGALSCALWQEWRKSRLPNALRPPADRVTGLALAATSLLVGIAALASWPEPWQAAPDEARSYLFGARGILTGLGLGGWLFIAAGALAALLPALSRRRPAPPVTGGPDTQGMTNPAADRASVAEAGLRFSYPWLLGALIASAAWSLAVFAIPWRGQPGEIWLAVNALLGVAYLQLASASWPPGTRFATYALAALGLVTALIAAWQVPTLF